jgi:hypothetical protein
MAQIFLTDEELARENKLFCPHDSSTKPLKGVKLSLQKLLEEEKKDAESVKNAAQEKKPAVFVPPSC